MPNQDQRYFNLNPYGASWPVTVERGQQFTDGSAGMGGIAGYGLEGFSLSDPIHQDGSQNIPLAEGQHTNQSLWQSAFGPEEMPDIDLEGLTMSDPEWLASPSQSNTEAPLPHDINNLMNTHIHQNQKKFLSEASDGQPRAETEIRQGDRSPGRGPSPAQSLQSSSGFDPEDNRFFNETFGDDDYYLPAIRTPERSVSPRVISSPFYPSQGTTEDDLVDISLASPALNGPPVETMESDPLEDSPKITGEYSSSATSTSRNDDEFDFHPGSSE
ncbi:hypothetical protein FQN50_005344 [Emmonsiellopsis sp. PD_5]|nr:hypothetical protein FQN50_005344 [Emmonsiellopsis sp. PD_5]